MPLIRQPENIRQAIHDVQAGKDAKKEMLDFTFNYMEGFKRIEWKLNHIDELDLGYVRKFQVFEPKQRDVNAPIVEERILHHCIGQILFPILRIGFSTRSFACIPSEYSRNFRMIPKNMRFGKGVLSACCNIQHDMVVAREKWRDPWVVYVDIRKYFPSINHDVLKHLYRRIVSDRELLVLIDKIIDSFDSECGFTPVGGGIFKTIPSLDDGDVHGRPIGYLTSQWDGNLVLNPLDHLIIDQLGHSLYTRYMDDLRVFCSCRSEAEDVLGTVDSFCKDRLKLTIHPVKSKIAPLGEQMPFCSYVVLDNTFLPRRSTVLRTQRRMNHLKVVNPDKIPASLNSFLGYMKWCDWNEDAVEAVRMTGIEVDFENRRLINV